MPTSPDISRLGTTRPASALGPPRVNLVGLDRDALDQLLTPLEGDTKRRKMRIHQLWQWVYFRGVSDFNLMSNLSREFRGRISEKFLIARPKLIEKQVSVDKTRKYLLQFGEGQEVETVFIPDNDRGTLCISSQIGCTLNCSFCRTGTQGLVRNLSASEIIGQILFARDDLEDWPGPGQAVYQNRKITNIVLMGMGEPLYNFDAVKSAMAIVMDGAGIAMSRRRITLSTSGVVPLIKRAGAEIGAMLAISLHATQDELRDKLVPINRKWNIETLLGACRDYPRLSNAERITFEYVMLKGLNDTEADARRLVRLISGIPAKINLIPFNPWPGAPYERSSEEAIERFAAIIMKAGYASPVRRPRGEDILAACGQLKSTSEKIRASQRRASSQDEAV